MRSPYRSGSSISYALGPGPVTPVVKALIIANVAMFVVRSLLPGLTEPLGLVPQEVVTQLRVWQFVTYLFLHGGVFHILFNMLTLWMFGVELERMWGSRYFTKFYFVAGIGAGLTQLLASFIPVPALSSLYFAQTIGASGAIYGLLLAYAMYFPHRQIMFFGIFPIEVRYFVLIMGAISLLYATDGGSGVAHLAHLGGLAAGYLYLKSGRVTGRINVMAEIKYRWVKWRINRMRKRFDVYSGGRTDDVNRRIH
jgi:membrane associated rhomboid family serine protease